MLSFNSFGLLVPPSPIISTLAEFEEYFVDGNTENIRRILFQKYIKYKNDLKSICDKPEMRQWIDGSFVTKKSNPADIDVVTFVDFETAQVKEAELKEFIYPLSSKTYGVDGYIIVVYPESHKLHFAYKADCSYWINHFDKTKPNKRHKTISKGFLEIIV